MGSKVDYYLLHFILEVQKNCSVNQNQTLCVHYLLENTAIWLAYAISLLLFSHLFSFFSSIIQKMQAWSKRKISINTMLLWSSFVKLLPFVCGVNFVNRVFVCIQNSEANMVIVHCCLSYEILLSFPSIFCTGIHILIACLLLEYFNNKSNRVFEPFKNYLIFNVVITFQRLLCSKTKTVNGISSEHFYHI